MQATDFVVAKHDLQQCRFIETALPDVLPPDALLVKVDRFAFTANNITYATLGDEMNTGSCFRHRRISATFRYGALAR
jgi:hypothetical protein